MPRKRTKPQGSKEPLLNANQVIAGNIRRARESLGITQTELAKRLSEQTGRSYSKAAISAMERSADGGKKRLFDVQEVVDFSIVFSLPMLWFFMPSVEQARQPLEPHGHDRGEDLVELMLGQGYIQFAVRDRLIELSQNHVDAKRGAPDEIEERFLESYIRTRAAFQRARFSDIEQTLGQTQEAVAQMSNLIEKLQDDLLASQATVAIEAYHESAADRDGREIGW